MRPLYTMTESVLALTSCCVHTDKEPGRPQHPAFTFDGVDGSTLWCSKKGGSHKESLWRNFTILMLCRARLLWYLFFVSCSNRIMALASHRTFDQWAYGTNSFKLMVPFIADKDRLHYPRFIDEETKSNSFLFCWDLICSCVRDQ